jgi:hypothetical protein
MVTLYVVSEYSSTSPTIGGGEKILGGPLYDLGRLQAIAYDATGVKLFTRDCVADVGKFFGGDVEKVAGLIQLVGKADYKDSEWCDNGKGAWAACDTYVVSVKEWIPTAQKEMRIEYFLKLAINRLGTLILTFSCHG